MRPRCAWPLPAYGGSSLELLKALPNLRRFSAHLEEIEGEIIVRETAITLPDLKELRLSGFPIWKGFAPSLNLPLLDSLILDPLLLNTDFQPLHEDSGYAQILTCFGHQLKTLSITHDFMTQPALSSCLQTLSNVADLRLSPVSYNDPMVDDPDIFILSKLAVRLADGRPSYPLLCPKLEEFDMTCRNTRPDGAAEMALAAFIAGRRPALPGGAAGRGIEIGDVTWLRKVDVYFKGDRKVDVLKEVRHREIDMKGFGARLTYRTPDRDDE